MKPFSSVALALSTVVCFSAAPAPAQEPKRPDANPGQTKPEAAPEKKTAAPAKKDQELNQDELDAKFKATLTNATMAGKWCIIKDGKAEPDKEDKYTISGVNKLFGDNWLVRARIQYGKRDVTVPVPVKVKWAGDTPVITVDGFSLPGGGSAYSARVLVYDNAYAGTWSAGDHGGLMSGLITQEKEKPATPEKE
jgi:hypothetical protein